MHNLADAFLALSSRWPDRPAIDWPAGKLTYSQLMFRASRIAELLRRRDVRVGDRIGIAQTNNAEAFLLMLGAWLCGATALVVDFRTRAAERKKLADSLGIKFFVEDRPSSGNESTIVVQNDAAWAEEAAGLHLVSLPSSLLGNPIAVIGVSSGTSGVPQPVALSHSCLYTRAALVINSPQWPRGCRLIATAPLSFTATRMNVLSCLLDGGSVYFTPLLVSSEHLAEIIESSKATAMLTVPATARGLMGLRTSRCPLFPSLEYLMCCGAPMSGAEKVAAKQVLTRGFLENYGSTMAGMLTLLESKDIEAHGNSVGRPLPHIRIEMVDEKDQPLPTGEVGTVRARTPGTAEPLSLGSSDDEQRTSDLLVDGWIYPGDIGALDESGFLRIVGRTSDMIIRGGAKVYPSEVESVLAEHTAIAEVAVVGWPDKVLGEEVAAFVVLRSQADRPELIAYCRSKLQPDKQPRDIFIVDAMPRNANGKLLKRELIARLPLR
jgi:acyl-CoA synthetase (AMP-forming)/AMP-acid ligase II